MGKHSLGHRGSALLVALIITILVSILATSFLEKVIRLEKTSGGIESSAQAYTLATGIIEEQLMNTTNLKKQPWTIAPRQEGSMSFSSTGRTLTALTGGTQMPVPGYGNSPFDPAWNLITVGEPVQIVIPDGVSWGSVDFEFRVPAGLGGVTSTGNASIISNSGIILWTFGYTGASLYASGETNIFKGSDINGSFKNISTFRGFTNTNQQNILFNVFYVNPSYLGPAGSKCSNYACTLKLSMIRPFLTAGGQSFPMLEYRITGLPNIPSQYMIIDSSAYVRGYLRARQVRIPQITTNTAVDFTILQ